MGKKTKEVWVLIDTIEKVKEFVRDTSQFDADMDLVSGRYIINAKSILGLFSLDLSEPVTLRITADEQEYPQIIETLKPFIVDEPR